MQDARVGRVGDVADGERDQYAGLARLCAAELTGKPLRSHTQHFFRIVSLPEMEVASGGPTCVKGTCSLHH